jgi:hypothetical protein
VPYVVGLCSKGTPQASQAGSYSMPRPISHRQKFRRREFFVSFRFNHLMTGIKT